MIREVLLYGSLDDILEDDGRLVRTEGYLRPRDQPRLLPFKGPIGSRLLALKIS